MKKPIPISTDDVRARLAGLSPSARHLLQATTALSSPFRPARLSALLERRLITLLPDIEEALDSGLLVTTGDMLAFGHERVRPVVEESMPAAVVAALRREHPPAAPARQPGDWDLLSDRELEVAQLVGLALTNQQIAGRLGRSPHTVNFHLRQIFRKLGVASRVELVSLLGKREAAR